MATGQRAVTGETAEEVQNAILNQTLPPIRTLNPKLPAALEKIISRALEKDREKRYSIAAEMLAGFAGIAGSREGRAKPISTGTMRNRKRLVIVRSSNGLGLDSSLFCLRQCTLC